MSNYKMLSGDWLAQSSSGEPLLDLIYARVMTIERNKCSMIIRFSNGKVLKVENDHHLVVEVSNAL